MSANFDPHAHFKLANIRLVGSMFATIAAIESETIDADSVMQTRRWNSSDIREYASSDGGCNHGLFVTVNLGLRVLRASLQDTSKASDDDVLFRIESTFRVEFRIVNSDYSTDDFARFVDLNATHIVWPFWREHVFTTLRHACLPAVEVPLLAPVSSKRTMPETPRVSDASS